MGVLLDALRSVEFLDGVGDPVVTRFMVLGKSADHPKGHQFWRAGAVPQTLVVPVTGEAKASIFSAEGREFIDQFLVSGECVGLASAIDGLPSPTDAQVTRAGEFFAISRPTLLRFLDEHPAVRARTTAMVGALYRRAVKEREAGALRPVQQRVAEFLFEHACLRDADGAKVLVRATQSEIAARLGTVREVVARVLGDFRMRGLVDRDERGLCICDWDGLEADAGVDAAGGESPTAGSQRRAHQARTHRFFLPMGERRRRRQCVEDAASCRERIGDLSLCCARGCPAALEDRESRASAARPRQPANRPGQSATAASGSSAATSRWRTALPARAGAPAGALERA